MFKFFDWFFGTVSSLWNFLISMIKGLLQLISLIPSAVNSLTTAIGILPSILVAFATATVTIATIFIIAGRQGGGQN